MSASFDEIDCGGALSMMRDFTNIVQSILSSGDIIVLKIIVPSKGHHRATIHASHLITHSLWGGAAAQLQAAPAHAHQ